MMNMKKIYTFTKMMLIALVAMTAFSSCEQDDSYDAETLCKGYWQGYLGVYYKNHWNVSGEEYATEMHFAHNGSYYTSGRGYEVDYDLRNPYSNYAYCTFKWFIVDGEITLIYDDAIWDPVYIRRYTLHSSHFYGYISDGTTRDIRFEFENVATSEWDGRYSGYGHHSGPYCSRQAPALGAEASDSVPFINRSEYCVSENGEQGISILSGTFATMMK
ncbi:MAG: hypothetical protein K2J86_03415 [Prevotella sp.]|nr:hypothetical protein [Prevotella sp.]